MVGNLIHNWWKSVGRVRFLVKRESYRVLQTAAGEPSNLKVDYACAENKI